MLVSPDLSVQVFVMMLKEDGHCEIVGAYLPPDVAYTPLWLDVASALRDRGARYIEMGIAASRPKIVDSILKAKFIPCAFFPAFEYKDGERIDYVVMSRSFENLDFQSLQFRGLNRDLLECYFANWKEMTLPPKSVSG
jgi:hypothetical protein